jgi:tRNA/tmRNA/rRNA uracil-C5-methylase (TrmA/RlmC/RlmD family)
VSRRRQRAAGPLLGQRIELDIGPVANLGCCVARHQGRVVFVRHALPGERVVAEVTEDHGGSFCRADAVTILSPSPDRVPPPCRFAGPGRCGGCDWQHADPAAQRRLKAEVVRDLFRRIGHLDLGELVVEEVPGGSLGWRTRAQFAVDDAGRLGLRRSRQHTVQPIDECLLVVPSLAAAMVSAPRKPDTVLDLVASSTGEVAVAPRSGTRRAPGQLLHERAIARKWQVHAGGFWQVHPQAAPTLVRCVLDLVAPRPGERALDLYAGVGLFTAALAEAVGPSGSVAGIEVDPVAAADGAANLADLPQATMRAGDVLELLQERPADLIVLDPPRAGAGASVMQAMTALAPRAIGYVSCDPATLAGDVRVAVAAGYRLEALRAFDLFPMTHHVECVALLTPDSTPDS